jgi:hypothetical protein
LWMKDLWSFGRKLQRHIVWYYAKNFRRMVWNKGMFITIIFFNLALEYTIRKVPENRERLGTWDTLASGGYWLC